MYYNKYLKYKNKYIKLQQGGASLEYAHTPTQEPTR